MYKVYIIRGRTSRAQKRKDRCSNLSKCICNFEESTLVNRARARALVVIKLSAAHQELAAHENKKIFIWQTTRIARLLLDILLAIMRSHVFIYIYIHIRVDKSYKDAQQLHLQFYRYKLSRLIFVRSASNRQFHSYRLIPIYIYIQGTIIQ